MTQLREGVVIIGGNSKAGGDKRNPDRSKLDGDDIDCNEVEDDEVGKRVQKTSKSKNPSKSKKTIKSSNFFISGAKLAFTELRQAFFKAPILYYFDLKHHIRIEIDVSGYAIDELFS